MRVGERAGGAGLSQEKRQKVLRRSIPLSSLKIRHQGDSWVYHCDMQSELWVTVSNDITKLHLHIYPSSVHI